MPLKLRLSLRGFLAIIAACGIIAWLARGWLFPNRLAGQRFALVGPIDIDRDGRDDRGRLKWMILRNGGTVDFDLPPPWGGKETGELTPRVDWYVTDDRLPLRDIYFSGSEPMVKMQSGFRARMGEVIKQARLDGVRPMPIERLLKVMRGDIRCQFNIDHGVWCGNGPAVADRLTRRCSGPAARAADLGR
jgi:hypothetical protein